MERGGGGGNRREDDSVQSPSPTKINSPFYVATADDYTDDWMVLSLNGDLNDDWMLHCCCAHPRRRAREDRGWSGHDVLHHPCALSLRGVAFVSGEMFTICTVVVFGGSLPVTSTPPANYASCGSHGPLVWDNGCYFSC